MIGVILWLLCDSVVLRCCIGVGMLWFFVFNLVWVGLVICLVVLLYSMGVVVIGVYSFVGVFGFGVMCVVGKFIDCFGDWVVIGWGFVVVVFFMLLFGVVFGYLGWLGVGLVWFDVGCFVVQVVNQVWVVVIQFVWVGVLSVVYLMLYYVVGVGGVVVVGMFVEWIGWGVMMFVVVIVLVVVGWVGVVCVSVDVLGELMFVG